MLQPSIARNPLALRKLLELCMQTEQFPFTHLLNCKLNKMRLRNGKTTKAFGGDQRIRGPRLATFDTPGANARPPAGPGRQRRPELRANKANRVMKWPSGLSQKEPKGFPNPHNYCYRNSLLQCLLHLPGFCRYLSSTHHECPFLEENCTVCALKALAQKYWTDRRDEDFPTRRKDGAIGTLDKAFRSCSEGTEYHQLGRSLMQEDPHEFLLFLYSELAEAAQDQPQQLECLFTMKRTAVRTCADCNHRRPKAEEDAFMDLGVEKCKPGESRSITDYIRRYLNESLDWTCDEDGCEADRQLQKEAGSKVVKQPQVLNLQWKISQAPELLCINLKRSGSAGTNKKMKDDIPYNEELDLTEFTEDGSELKYRLFSVVAHSGTSPKSGHYIAAVRKREEGFQTISDLDREEYKTPDFDELRYPSFEDTKFDPVLLFYSKIA
ncbi:hypothetical protein LTR37_004227 [Vermiconidia calcicola]|uniref:Uncharacterized protein n=1 Tax=Vermiconidia calcicola TaxID=1690605 RepID=A0ACC3NN43_9PEZI|nr:hypothetical protein LTR37_004227 [Vermiconidia calcicola]